MSENLLVRVYKVGFGDCIYVRIPDGEEHFHIMIDCGTKSGIKVLEPAVKDLLASLPDKKLDLLIATHAHSDHIKGFDSKYFKEITIDRIWLPVSMKENHEQAKKMIAMKNLANLTATALLERAEANPDIKLSPYAKGLLAKSVYNKTAINNLEKNLSKDKRYPAYISRDKIYGLKNTEPANPETYDFKVIDGIVTFCGFKNPDTKLFVLAPEWDIDKYYFGKGMQDNTAFFDMNLTGMTAYHDVLNTFEEGMEKITADKGSKKYGGKPVNISKREFRILQNRLLYAALAFSASDDGLKNNTSLVLLLEWHGRRLLFTGDAEWNGKGVKEERHNATWDVMVSIPKVKDKLLKPLDYLKVGHHGSRNGTPFGDEDEQAFLDKFARRDKTKIVVSTDPKWFKGINKVPYPALLKQLGARAVNRRIYAEETNEILEKVPQPRRTDYELMMPNKKVGCIEEEISSGK